MVKMIEKDAVFPQMTGAHEMMHKNLWAFKLQK